MSPKKLTVVQCWDDGVTADVRLIGILRRYGAKATFNLNLGLHEKQRKPGTYNEAVMEVLREAGHIYARTTQNVDKPFPPANAMEFHPNCHFRAQDIWERYEKAREGGVFYFWGHSYEMITEEMWSTFESMIARISNDPTACWGDLTELFNENRTGI